MRHELTKHDVTNCIFSLNRSPHVDTFQWSLCSTTNIYHSFESHKSQSVNVGPLLNVLMVSNLASHSPAGRPRLAMTFVPWKETLTVDHQPQPQRSIQCLESQPSDMYPNWQRGFANSRYTYMYVNIYIYDYIHLHFYLHTCIPFRNEFWMCFIRSLNQRCWTTKQINKGTHQKKNMISRFWGCQALPRPALERDD